MSFFDCGGVRMMLSRARDSRSSIIQVRSCISRFATSRPTIAELLERGVTFLGEPHLIARMPDHELWMAFFRDSEGNTLALMEEKR